ncbi:MAG: redox-sensing transcriptional repressor Rex [Ruminococcus sp.]|nr:redox-sensing transcriptional repressor Rex [Ruminococcus sp.]
MQYNVIGKKILIEFFTEKIYERRLIIIGKEVSKRTLKRLPNYLTYLKSEKCGGAINISAPTVARDLGLNEVQVRKDLAIVSRSGGKPKTGYLLSSLIEDIESFLGYDNQKDAIIAGVGHLGSALLSYKGFSDYGMNVVAGFDTDEKLIGKTVHGKKIYDISELTKIVKELNIRLGIITVPSEFAQQVCNEMVKGGILAVWNFAQVQLVVPDGVIVQNENMAASLAVLSAMID